MPNPGYPTQTYSEKTQFYHFAEIYILVYQLAQMTVR